MPKFNIQQPPKTDKVEVLVDHLKKAIIDINENFSDIDRNKKRTINMSIDQNTGELIVGE